MVKALHSPLVGPLIFSPVVVAQGEWAVGIGE